MLYLNFFRGDKKNYTSFEETKHIGIIHLSLGHEWKFQNKNRLKKFCKEIFNCLYSILPTQFNLLLTKKVY